MDKHTIENRFRLDCECGGCSLVADYLPEQCLPEETVIFLSHHIDTYYAEEGLITMILKRISLAWKVITGQRHFQFELGIRRYQLEDFRDYINKVIVDDKINNSFVE